MIKKQYHGIITAGREGETPYYTNSSHLPVGYTSDIFEALDIQDELQTLYTSGTVFHAFLGEKLPDWKAAATLVRKIAQNYKLPYYTISPTLFDLQRAGYIAGELLPVLTVEKKQRFTAGSPVITVRSRTGMMERHRNTKIVNYMRSVLLN